MSTIKLIPDIDTFKIICAIYENCEFKINIDVKVYEVTNLCDDSNPGKIIEDYRKSKSDTDWENHKHTLNNFICKIKVPPFPGFSPDFVMCFLPSDKNRETLLKKFKEKVILDIPNKDDIDYSRTFKKNDPNKSIRDGLTNKDYDLCVDKKITSIEKLLVIDDTIDKGCTLKIFLDNLLEKKLINSQTTVKVTCIYNNKKNQEYTLPSHLSNKK